MDMDGMTQNGLVSWDRQGAETTFIRRAFFQFVGALPLILPYGVASMFYCHPVKQNTTNSCRE
jgi:hypothetical protein